MDTATVQTQSDEVQFLELVLPEQTNHYGTLYGANALHLMGKAAFVCASRYARCTIVMARSEAIDFVKPVKLGDLIDLKARVVAQGRSSLTVRVELTAERIADGSRYHAISGSFVMVAVNAEGRPVPLASNHLPKQTEDCCS